MANAKTLDFMERFENCIQECSNDDLRLTLIFYGEIKINFWAFKWQEFMVFVEAFGTKIYK